MQYVYEYSRCVADYTGYMFSKSEIISTYNEKVMVNYMSGPDLGLCPTGGEMRPVGGRFAPY